MWQEVLSNVAGTLKPKDLCPWDAALRGGKWLVPGGYGGHPWSLMKLVDRLLERSKSLASLHVYIRLHGSRVGLVVSLLVADGGRGSPWHRRDLHHRPAECGPELAVSLAPAKTPLSKPGGEGSCCLVTKPFQGGGLMWRRTESAGTNRGLWICPIPPFVHRGQ